MRGQAPRGIGLEHVVLEDEVVRVGPVVRDVRAVVVAHHVGAATAVAARRVVRLGAAGHALLLLGDEPVHLAAVDVGLRGREAVGTAEAAVLAVVERADAAAGGGIRHARNRPRVPGQARDPVRARVGAEVGVERAVLLHDDHHVPDLVDPLESRRRWCDRRRGGGARGGGRALCGRGARALPTRVAGASAARQQQRRPDEQGSESRAQCAATRPSADRSRPRASCRDPTNCERCYAPEARRASRPSEAGCTSVASGWRKIAVASDRIETGLGSRDAATAVLARVRPLNRTDPPVQIDPG